MDIAEIKSGMWQKYRSYIIAGAVIILATAGIYYAYYRITNAEAIAQQAAQVTQQHMKNATALENELNISKSNAQQLADYAAKVAARKANPVTTVYVTAPTIKDAAQQVQERINEHDTTLPSAALEKTDRTAVVANTDQQKVDVYKVNLDKPRGIGVYASTESIGAIVQVDKVVVFGGPKYKNGGYEVGAAWMKRF